MKKLKFLLLATMALFLSACQKDETFVTKQEKEIDLQEVLALDFFQSGYLAHKNQFTKTKTQERSTENDFILEVKAQLALFETQTPYVEQLTHLIGYPGWIFSTYYQNEQGDETLLLPFAQIEADSINSILVVHKENGIFHFNFEHRYTNLYGLDHQVSFAIPANKLHFMVETENLFQHFDFGIFGKEVSWRSSFSGETPASTRTVMWIEVYTWQDCDPNICCPSSNGGCSQHGGGGGYWVVTRVPIFVTSSGTSGTYGGSFNDYSWHSDGETDRWGNPYGGGAWINDSSVSTEWHAQLTNMEKRELNKQLQEFIDKYGIQVWNGSGTPPVGYTAIEDLYLYAMSNGCLFAPSFTACMEEMFNGSNGDGDPPMNDDSESPTTCKEAAQNFVLNHPGLELNPFELYALIGGRPDGGICGNLVAFEEYVWTTLYEIYFDDNFFQDNEVIIVENDENGNVENVNVKLLPYSCESFYLDEIGANTYLTTISNLTVSFHHVERLIPPKYLTYNFNLSLDIEITTLPGEQKCSIKNILALILTEAVNDVVAIFGGVELILVVMLGKSLKLILKLPWKLYLYLTFH